jgi:hypothetical protein
MACSIAQAKLDYYYVAKTEQIHPDVRSSLDKTILPSGHAHLPAVPNFFMEAKGPDGLVAECKRQAYHDGAIGVRAIHSLQTFGQKNPVHDNSARMISTIFYDGQLKMYACSTAQPNGPGTQPEYYMHQIGTWSMTDNSNQKTFLRGATAFKNALDLTKKYRDNVITQANKIVSRVEEHQDVHASGIEEEQQEPREEDDDEDGNDDGEEQEEEERDVAESSFMSAHRRTMRAMKAKHQWKMGDMVQQRASQNAL